MTAIIPPQAWQTLASGHREKTSVRTVSQKGLCYKNQEHAMFKGTTAQTLRCSVYE